MSALEEQVKRSKFKSFLEGMARVLDIGGTLYKSHPVYDNPDLTPEEKDAIMLAQDWQAVGNDILCGMNCFKKTEYEK